MSYCAVIETHLLIGNCVLANLCVYWWYFPYSTYFEILNTPVLVFILSEFDAEGLARRSYNYIALHVHYHDDTCVLINDFMWYIQAVHQIICMLAAQKSV